MSIDIVECRAGGYHRTVVEVVEVPVLLVRIVFKHHRSSCRTTRTANSGGAQTDQKLLIRSYSVTGGLPPCMYFFPPPFTLNKVCHLDIYRMQRAGASSGVLTC